MRVEGTYTFPGASSRVFSILTNPDALARAIPGCERFIQFGPANGDGQTAYEMRLRLGERRLPYVVNAQVTVARHPDYLRFELRGYGPSGAIIGEGSLDLVEQESHTVVAYRLTLTGPDLPEGSDIVAREANFMARATCAHLADEMYAEAEDASGWLPGTLSAVNPGKLDSPSTAAPTWGTRAVWMGAGLALGLGAIALTVAAIRRMSERDGLAG